MELHLTLKYEQADIISAQRQRFRGSSQLKFLGVAAIVGVLFLAVPLVRPGLFGVPARSMTWYEPVALLGVIVLAPLLVYFVGPAIDYRRNRVWRTEWNLRLNNKGLRMHRSGAKKSFEMDWSQVSRVEENDRVFLLFYGASDRFVLIPKHVFQKPEQMAFFRKQVKA